MRPIELKGDNLIAQVAGQGGLILGLWWDCGREHIPLLRPAASPDANATGAGCFPLVPFGGRIRDNRFYFDGQEHLLEPNTPFERHRLHGEGWQGLWRTVEQQPRTVSMAFSHTSSSTPYAYSVIQSFSILDDAFEMRMAVTNHGARPLPFGLGWHPYFPLTPATTLTACAERLWTEVEDWLPGEPVAIPEDLDFSTPRHIPERWIHNGFQGWTGTATIAWPERSARLHLEADRTLKHAVMFRPDRVFDSSYGNEYFCFEPMSHLVNGHNMPDFGDLSVLQPGQELGAGMRLRPEEIPHLRG